MENTNQRGLPKDGGADRVHNGAVNLQSILGSTTKEDFIRDYWGQRFLHQEGCPGRFGCLFGWDQLNSILETHQLQSPQLLLVQNGKPIAPSLYLHSRGPGAPPRIKSRDLMKCLAKGATLVLNHIDEIDPALRDLASNIEDELWVPTSVNLYGAWRREPGFDLHWDIQETLILQISGRKSWRVYNPTRLHPLKEDVVNAEVPTGSPVWEGSLSDGDILYMPRGWWHVAISTDEPSLHLTVTVQPYSGYQFLGWLVDQLRIEPVVRMDVPHLARLEEQRKYVEKLFDVISQHCANDLLERFLRDFDSKIVSRPRFTLPNVASSTAMDLHAGSLIYLETGRRLGLPTRDQNGKVEFVANHLRWKCSSALLPALALLHKGRPRRVSELHSVLNIPEGLHELKMLLVALAAEGVIAIRD